MLALAVLLAVVALLGLTSLVAHDTFFSELRIQPEDAGASDFEIVVRGTIYSALALAGAAALALAAAVGSIALIARGDASARRRVIAAVVAIVAGAILALLLALVLFGGFRSFADDNASRLVAIVLLAFALSAAVTLVLLAIRSGDQALAAAALVIIAVAVLPAVLLSREGGRELADAALAGHELRPGAFDPMQMRAEPVCILPRRRTALETEPVRTYVLLGESAGAPLLYDPAIRRSFRVAAERLGILRVANEVCRAPGEPVPVEVGSPEEDAALARRYRPILRFDSREPWRPLNIEAFATERYAKPPVHHRVCGGDRCADLRSTAELTAARSRIDIRGSGGDYDAAGLGRCLPRQPMLDCPDRTSAIYYNVRREDRRVYVDYWWFFRFNHFPRPVGRGRHCGGRATPGSQHEGDWEGITVVSKFGKPEELDYVVLSSHGHSVRYRPGVVKIVHGRQPKIFIACGSHAAYPRTCAGPKRCRQTATQCRGRPCDHPVSVIAEAPFDGQEAWHRNDDSACFTRPICLLPLPREVTPAGARPREWTDWAGRWGAKNGPRSPARQARFREPWRTIPSNRTEFDREARPGKRPASEGPT